MKFFTDEKENKQFLLENMMGPNAVMLAEELTKNITLTKDMRILDLGCGTGLTSIFLAKTFGVTVFAVDLWIEAEANYNRVKQFGLEDQIIPLNIDALKGFPFAKGYFDAVISVDSYHYYGYTQGYLEERLLPYVKPNGMIAITIPGLKHDLVNGEPPEEMKPFWVDDMNFYTTQYWRNLWSESGLVSIELCNEAQCCEQAWADWLESDNPYAVGDRDMMKVEAGNYFNFVQIVGRVK